MKKRTFEFNNNIFIDSLYYTGGLQFHLMIGKCVNTFLGQLFFLENVIEYRKLNFFEVLLSSVVNETVLTWKMEFTTSRSRSIFAHELAFWFFFTSVSNLLTILDIVQPSKCFKVALFRCKASYFRQKQPKRTSTKQCHAYVVMHVMYVVSEF